MMAALAQLGVAASCGGVSPESAGAEPGAPARSEEWSLVRHVPGGDAPRGRAAVREAGCGFCHVIPGVEGAAGTVGPPLIDFARRRYLAGALANETPNLIRWIIDPQSVKPGTAMPALGISEPQARDMAAYLYTIRGESLLHPATLVPPSWLQGQTGERGRGDAAGEAP